MALKVTTAKSGLQGSTANPQKTAPATVVQNAPNKVQTTAPIRYVQNAAPAAAVQNAAAAAQIANNARIAAERVQAAAAAAAAEVVRKREESRVRVQGVLNVKMTSNLTTLKSAAAPAAARTKLRVGRVTTPKIILPKDERSDYQKAYDEAFANATADARGKTDGGKKNKFASLWDKVSFGQDRRDVTARAYADKKAAETAKKQVASYEKTLSAFLKEQASRRSNIEKTKFMNQGAFDFAKSDYEKWESGQITALERARGSVTGGAEAYTKFGQSELTAGLAKGLRTANNVFNPVKSVLGNVMKYTLGQGSKNVPSLVTAPGRAVNFIGNLNTKDRQIYQEGGGAKNRAGSGNNAWQSTFNQRNFNIKPWTDKAYDKAAAEKKFGSQATSYVNAMKSIKTKNKNATDRDKVLQMYWKKDNSEHKQYNSLLVNVADPALGLGALGKSKYVSKVTDALQASKGGVLASSFIDKVKSNKVVSWLGAEHKNVAVRRAEFVDQELDDIAAKSPQIKKQLINWQKNKSDIKTNFKDSVERQAYNDFAGMTSGDRKVFQRFVQKGDWNVRGGNKIAPEKRAELESMASKYKAMFDDLQKKENKKGIATPYRENYLPQYTGKWSKTVTKFKKKMGMQSNELWFTKHRDKNRIQNKKQLISSISARRYHSAAARQDLPVLRDVIGGRDDVARNIDRIENADKYVKKTGWEKAMSVVGAPTRAWKKSVLLANPAWYVNNEIFNQMQGITHGGLKFIMNQRKTGKYLEHIKDNAKARYAPSVARKMVSDVGSTVSKEVGSGRLARLATKQENRARVALYRTFRQDGMSHADATKKLDKALFNYTTKNWERPVKAIVPFYHFQKSIIKAAVRMPFEAPRAALAYNNVDQLQDQQFNNQFDKEVVPGLKKLVYSDDEIEKYRKEQAKYYGNKLRLPNGKYTNTPFNAFSDKGLGNLGLNPYLAASGEISSGKDNFGQQMNGRDSTFVNRLMSKFPQAQLAKDGVTKALIKSGRIKATNDWIGAAGSAGYGQAKQAQGYDPSKPNYQKKLDGGAKFNDNFSAFLGKPRQSTFDTKAFLEREQMKRVKTAYFALDTKNLNFDKAEEKRNAIFKKYGVTADQFYKGELAKYDTTGTKTIKDMKEDASKKTAALFDEYGKQPVGTRGIWAAKKLRELNASGYFDKNPFLKSFDWTTPETIAKADRTLAYRFAKESGNWMAYNAKYGDTRKHTAFQADGKFFKTRESRDQYLSANIKYKAAQEAAKTGEWDAYRAKYGTKPTSFQADGKFFKTPESMVRYQNGKFWDDYSKADKPEKEKMLAANPQYDTRSKWTTQDWQYWRLHRNDDMKNKVRSQVAAFTAKEEQYKYTARIKSQPIVAKRNARSKNVKVAYALST